MRVLLINSFYYRRAGAEAHFLDLEGLLIAAGHEVAVFSMQHPDNLPSDWSRHWPANVEYRGRLSLRSRLGALRRSAWSPEVRDDLAALLRDWRPDVAHLHCAHHHLTLSVIEALAGAGVPSLWTLHDYRTVCPATNLLRRGQACEACAGGAFWHAVPGRCKSGSAARSFAAAVESYDTRRRGTLAEVGCYIAPSGFLADTVMRMGLRAQRIEVLPNFIAQQPETALPTAAPPDEAPFVYVGRLAAEKGVSGLLGALQHVPGARLKVIGDGPDGPALRAKAQSLGLAVEFTGWVGRERVLAEMARARALVCPSVWYENSPLAVLDAMAVGLPVIASRIGGLSELLAGGECGLLLAPADTEAWVLALRDALRDPTALQAPAARARERVRARHDSDAYVRRLVTLYEEVGRCRPKVTAAGVSPVAPSEESDHRQSA